MKALFACVMTALLFAVAGPVGTAQAAPATKAVEAGHNYKQSHAAPVIDVHRRRWHRRHYHRRWHRRHRGWHRYRHCRRVYRCWRGYYGRRCGWVRRCR